MAFYKFNKYIFFKKNLEFFKKLNKFEKILYIYYAFIYKGS